MQTTWQDVKKEIIALAAVLDVPITAEKIKWYEAILKPMGPDVAFAAIRTYGLTTRHRRLPLPAELMGNDGEFVAASIIRAISKFGRTDPEGARESLGPAWKIVQHFGGWSHICENLRFKDQGTFIAQARDLWSSLQKQGATNGTHRQQIGDSQPANIAERTKSIVGHALRGLPGSQGPHQLDGVKDPSDGES